MAKGSARVTCGAREELCALHINLMWPASHLCVSGGPACEHPPVASVAASPGETRAPPGARRRGEAAGKKSARAPPEGAGGRDRGGGGDARPASVRWRGRRKRKRPEEEEEEEVRPRWPGPARAGVRARRRAPRNGVRGALLPSAPTTGQRRCLEAAPGGVRRWSRGGARVSPRHGFGCRSVPDRRSGAGARRAVRCGTGRPAERTARYGSCGVRCSRSCGRRGGLRNRPAALNRFRRTAPGVPGADRPWSDRAAVPCRPVTHTGARSHDARHDPDVSSLQRSHAWFFRGPPLAGTDTRNNEAAAAGHAPYG